MRQLVILFVVLFGSFLGIWAYKIQTPVNRPDEYAEGTDTEAGAWWTTTTISADEEWELDPEIPLNYIPVPGEDELYMVIDNDGNITGYRRRTLQIDGSWLWEDVNPDIPENYEAVEGLEDVYMVTYDDGTVQYFKYIRNDDDTFAFVEVDENGEMIGIDRDATIIDGNHVHITGNTYALLNDYGVIIGYDKRVDNGDGSYSWIDTTLPDMTDLSGLYGSDYVLGSGLTTNSDAFNQSLDGSGLNLSGGDLTTTYNYDITINKTDTYIDDNGNICYDDGNGNVIILNADTYYEDSDGNGYYLYAEALDGSMPELSGQYSSNEISAEDYAALQDQVAQNATNAQNASGTIVINNGDGTHTEEETITETRVENGYTYTYETYVKRTYDAEGNLISTISDGPYETASQRELTQTTDPVQSLSPKESTLSSEVARVTGSYSYRSADEGQVLALLNAQRASNGLSTLSNTDTANNIAYLRAADMAGYDTSEENLPTYGTLSNMMGDYGITSSVSGANQWKSVDRTAEEIHTRFQALDETRKLRMNENATQYGIGIVESNGYIYICEVIL